VDQDGWIDLVEVNGRPAGEWANERAKLFRNLGGSFEEIAETAGLDSIGEGRAVVYLDADGDGDLDLIIVNNNDDLDYYENTSSGGGWIQFTLDTATNPLLPPDGFGARVELDAAGRTQVRLLNGSPSYLGTSELLVHFGLGDAPVVDEVRVYWPRGQVTVITSPAASVRHVITAPQLGDLNADGIVGIDDLLGLLAVWGPVGSAADLRADLDGDGLVAIDDLLLLLAVWDV
jgi:hypothetical protein